MTLIFDLLCCKLAYRDCVCPGKWWRKCRFVYASLYYKRLEL